VFSSVPQTSSLRSRAWGILVGTIVMVGVPIMLISAKMVQAVLPLLLVAALAGAVARDRLADAKPLMNSATMTLAVFVAYAALSGLWAPDPVAAVSIALMAVAVTIGSLALFSLLRSEPHADALHVGEGLWIGVMAGAIYTIAEVFSDQAIKIWAYNLLGLGPDVLRPERYFTWANGRVASVHPDDLTRNVVPLPLLIWPALMAARPLPARIWRPCVYSALLGLSAVAILGATSETGKLAFAVGVLAFAMAHFSTRLAHYTIAAVWLVACLAVVPLARLARQFDLQDASWVQLTGQIRLSIWNEIAQLVPKAPILGVGADMTYVIRPRMHEVPLAAPDYWAGFPLTHPHNVYLQIWYELGLVGAALLTVFGLMVLRQICRLREAQRPFAFALFAASAAQIGFSYNLWQIWFMCLFGFAVAMFALGLNISSSDP
jgi:O-antigen ligase